MAQYLKNVKATGIQNGITNVLLETFVVTLLKVTLQVKHKSSSDQLSIYWPL
jgi:hypothetical protein